MKKFKSALILALAGVMLLMAGCVSPKAQTVKVAGDEIPSFYAVVGEKKIVGTETSTENGVDRTTITYEEGSISEREATDYMLELIGTHGFGILQDKVDDGDGKTYLLSKDSAADGKYIVVRLYVNEGGNTVIQYTVGGADIL